MTFTYCSKWNDANGLALAGSHRRGAADDEQRFTDRVVVAFIIVEKASARVVVEKYEGRRASDVLLRVMHGGLVSIFERWRVHSRDCIGERQMRR